MRLVVHLHGLRVLERLAAASVGAQERPSVLNEVHRDHRGLVRIRHRLELIRELCKLL